jgi:hypothetical protein
MKSGREADGQPGIGDRISHQGKTGRISDG